MVASSIIAESVVCLVLLFSDPDIAQFIASMIVRRLKTFEHCSLSRSDFVLGSSCAGLYFGLLAVAMTGVVSIDPLVVTVGPDQLNYGTQPKGAMILRRVDRGGSLQVHTLEFRPLTRPPVEEEEASPNLSLTDDELVIRGRHRLRGLRGLTKPVEESVDHDVRQNRVGIGTLKEFE
jgi:hypothetical protein